MVSCARMIPARSFMEVSAGEIYDWSRAHVSEAAEAVFIGGNGMRAIGAIQALEEALALAVLTANQVSMWQALRVVGITSRITQYPYILQTRKRQRSFTSVFSKWWRWGERIQSSPKASF